MNLQTKEGSFQAIEKFLAAQVLFHENGDKHLAGWFLNMAGFVHSSSLGDRQKGMDLYQKGLAEARSINDDYIEAMSLHNLGSTIMNLGNPRKGLEFFQDANRIRRKIRDLAGEILSIQAIGRTYNLLGEHEKSIEYHKQTLEFGHNQKEYEIEVNSLLNLGLTHNLLGANQKALEYYQQALHLAQTKPDKLSEGKVLNNIGGIYLLLGHYESAIEYFSKAQKIWQPIGNRSLFANSLDNLGNCYLGLQNPVKGLEYFTQSLEIRQSLRDQIGMATTLKKIGHVFFMKKDFAKAGEYYKKGLALDREVGNRQEEANALVSLGNIELETEHFEAATDLYEKALSIQKELNDRVRQTVTYYSLAKTAVSQRDFRKAQESIENALRLAENVRSQVAVTELRTTYFAQYRQYYDLYINILMELHKREPTASFAAEALAISEQARARTLVELLSEARSDYRQGVQSDLIERETSLRNRVNAKADLMLRLKATNGNPTQVEEFEKEITTLTRELEQTRAEIRQKSPRYATLTQPQPLTVSEIQKLLDPDTILLEYALGEKQSYLWAVTDQALTSYQLPEISKIEAQARKVYECLTLPNTIEPQPRQSVAQRNQEDEAAEAAYRAAAAQLSETILGPVADKLGKKRLIVIGDGALQYIPFGALPKPQNSGKENPHNLNVKNKPEMNFLVLEHEIVNLPSASTLVVQRREFAGRKPAEKQLAILADPVFQSNDPRLATAASNKAATPKGSSNRSTPNKAGSPASEWPDRIDLTETKLRQSAQETRLSGTEIGLPRLVFSRREAQAIASLFPTNQTKSALDWAANRKLVTADDVSQYRIIHFATHGLLNSQHPELSGLVLSLVDERGDPQNGFVLMTDVFDLKLSADLVVLSACQTGLGKEIRGEGLQGLARGFMYAGAERVVVSLWNVNDRATAELMSRFYQNMLTGKQRPAAALRAAQVEMLHSNRWKSPFYWAPFVLQGEWR
ncbi:MAG: CHAT domain-containing protein [Blastocatellia bacterium]|nr:CHAT domain-containing protein [Blastocatellia bacterium]